MNNPNQLVGKAESFDILKLITWPVTAPVEWGAKVGQMLKDSTSIDENISKAAQSVADTVQAPAKAVGNYLDKTTTKILIIGALALVGVVVVKKVID